MRLPWLLGFVLLGCAHHDASLRASNYEYGQDNRPYTGIPDYLKHEPKPTAPATCDNCIPGQPDTRDQEQPE